MNASALPTVGKMMSPRGSFGFGSMAKRIEYPWSMTYSARRSSPSRYRSSAARTSFPASASDPSRPPQKTYVSAPRIRGEVEPAHHLAQRVSAHPTVIRGERAFLEHRMCKEVGRRHRHDKPGIIHRSTESFDEALAFRLFTIERDEIVVVERHAVRTEFGETSDRLDRVEWVREWRHRTYLGLANLPSTTQRKTCPAWSA